MKRNKITVMSCLICFFIVLFHSESVIGQAVSSDLYVHVQEGRTNVSNATVLAKGPSSWKKLEYTLTPWGWAYYGYVQAGNYDIYVDGTKMTNIYVRGRKEGQVYVPSNTYANATCRK
ncbi:MAG: hypothetical protein DRI57_27820 [Deltaproteobacteria bacterium]|nr:MAG: hypothetical protein DRI57_27820 [Deltaproteobacteria bacterium]